MKTSFTHTTHFYAAADTDAQLRSSLHGDSDNSASESHWHAQDA